MPDRRGREGWGVSGPSASTPLDPDDAVGLIPSWVATRADLNQAEQRNMLQGLSRRRWTRISAAELLDDLVVRALHRDMFGKVWTWAGSYRNRELSIGVDPALVSTCVRDIIDDAQLWISGDGRMAPDEAGYRFHHRLVQVHPFPNGNGRHGRAMTDLLMRAIGGEPFTWGSTNRDAEGRVRDAYIAALRAADANDYEPLARFVRS